MKQLQWKSQVITGESFIKKITYTELEGIKNVLARHPTNCQGCTAIGDCPGKVIFGIVLPNVSDVTHNVRDKQIT